MEQAISKFLDVMPALDMDGFPSEEEKSARQDWLKGRMEFLRRHTVFYTSSAKLCCGVTQTTPCVNPKRYIPVCMYQYVLVYTSMY